MNDNYKCLLEILKVDLNVGDTILVGKFKNKRAVVKGCCKKDKNNQPRIETDVGDRSLFKFRINKLMPEDKRKKERDEIEKEEKKEK